MNDKVITANEYYRRAVANGAAQHETLRLVLHENHHPHFWVTVKGAVDFDSIADQAFANKGMPAPKRRAYAFVVAFQNLTRGEFEAVMVEQFKQANSDADNFQAVARQLMERGDKVVIFKDEKVLVKRHVDKAFRDYGCEDAGYDAEVTGPGLPSAAVIQRYIKQSLQVAFTDDNVSGFRRPVARPQVRVVRDGAPGM